MIRAYIGLLGEGKTLSMVNDAVHRMEKKKKVVSNFPIKWKKWGKKYESVYLAGKEFENAFLKETDCLFCIDEASIVLPNYYWNRLPGEFLIKFAQSRKYGLDIFYTSQGYSHAVKRLRDLTNEVVKCEKKKLMGMTIFTNIVYNPDFFEQRIITSLEIEKKYIIRRKVIDPFLTKHLFKAFDTMYKVNYSSLVEVNEERLIKEVEKDDFQELKGTIEDYRPSQEI